MVVLMAQSLQERGVLLWGGSKIGGCTRARESSPIYSTLDWTDPVYLSSSAAQEGGAPDQCVPCTSTTSGDRQRTADDAEGVAPGHDTSGRPITSAASVSAPQLWEHYYLCYGSTAAPSKGVVPPRPDRGRDTDHTPAEKAPRHSLPIDGAPPQLSTKRHPSVQQNVAAVDGGAPLQPRTAAHRPSGRRRLCVWILAEGGKGCREQRVAQRQAS